MTLNKSLKTITVKQSNIGDSRDIMLNDDIYELENPLHRKSAMALLKYLKDSDKLQEETKRKIDEIIAWMNELYGEEEKEPIGESFR